jgi:hypothetical protein
MWVIKNAEFDVEFESVKKVATKFTQRKLEGENFAHSTKR